MMHASTSTSPQNRKLFAAVCVEMARSDVGFLIQPPQRTNEAGKPDSYKVQWLLHCTPLSDESAAGDGGGCTAVLQELVPSELVMPQTETAKPITADEREQAGRLRARARVGARVAFRTQRADARGQARRRPPAS